MGTSKANTSVDGRVSSTLERLERLMTEPPAQDVEHTTPETVEDAVRRLKGKLPEKQLRTLGD